MTSESVFIEMTKRKNDIYRASYTAGARRRRKSRNFTAMIAVLLCVGVVFFIIRMQARRSETPEAGITSMVKHYHDLESVNGAPENSTEKDYEGFRLSFNPVNKTPDWVGWELLATEVDGNVTRSNKFHTDYEVEGCPDTRDYTRSGYDRGHLCPAADQKWSSQAMSDCFYMTNMAPQKKELNTGAWKTLEEKERIWARRDSALVIVAGPIYTGQTDKRIGEAGVRVPDAFYKCILAPYANPPRAIAFVYDNARCPGNMANYVTTVDQVEAITGLDFFYNLPDEIENEVERHSEFKKWQ